MILAHHQHYLPEPGGCECVGALIRFLDVFQRGYDRSELPEDLVGGARETDDYWRRAGAERFSDFSQAEASAIADWLKCFSKLSGAEDFCKETSSALLYWGARGVQ